jgi:ubiquinol-cytochrome c reductase cytochrome b subunit
MNEPHASSHSKEPQESFVARRTTLGLVLENILEEPSVGLSAWARTTAGIVVLLLALQLFTGVLLAFYYVPSAESAHATVAYVEKVLSGGSWIRALHFYGSQLLPLALVLHLAQMLWRGAYERKPLGWLMSVLLFGLSMANGATGYSLPWDVRAFFSTRIAENITAGLPLVGEQARQWLVGGAEISTLTLSRFFALHALVVPSLLLAVACTRLFIFREPNSWPGEAHRTPFATWPRAQLARNAVVAGLSFAALAWYASKFPAPLGPPIETAPPGYLPRPGAQFLWLFQLLKFFSKTNASLVAFFLPALLLGTLALLPFVRASAPAAQRSRRRLGLIVFAFGVLLVAGMTFIAYRQDALDPRVREQLAKQAQKEAEFRNAPFTPQRTGASQSAAGAETAALSANATPTAGDQSAQPPEAFRRNCAKCHGPRAEGKSIYPPLAGISAHPQRTVEDIVAIMNNPSSYGLEPRMPSFARKLSEEEKRAVAEWIVSLK